MPVCGQSPDSLFLKFSFFSRMLLKKSAQSHGVTTVTEEVSYRHQYACVISHMHLVNLLYLNDMIRDYVEHIAHSWTGYYMLPVVPNLGVGPVITCSLWFLI